jgi:hypothetical protein
MVTTTVAPRPDVGIERRILRREEGVSSWRSAQRPALVRGAGAQCRAGFVDSCHYHLVGWNADDEEPVVVWPPSVKIRTALLDGHEALIALTVNHQIAAPVETDYITRGKTQRAVDILVYSKPMYAGIPLSQDNHTIIGVAPAIEIIAAAVDSYWCSLGALP